MTRAVRWTVRITGALVILVLIGVAIVYGFSERQLRAKYAFDARTIVISTDSASVARGDHLFHAITNCALCHDDDAGGKLYADMGPVGLLAGPNLTRGRGGIGSALMAVDFERAIRHGVHRDSTSLIVMPAEVFAYLSDRDVGALIAYLQSVPPIDRELPRSHFGPVGRALLAAGKLDILVAHKVPSLTPPADVLVGATPEYGRYLANVAGCHGCHGYGLSGGRVAGPSDLPPASNLTPTGIGRWTEDDFNRAMRTGTRPDGSKLNEFMPWRMFARMTDDETHALWTYIRSVAPKVSGNK